MAASIQKVPNPNVFRNKLSGWNKQGTWETGEYILGLKGQ